MKICARFHRHIFITATCASTGTLKPGGKYLLDAGSGPIQYPEYLTYSKAYQLPRMPGLVDCGAARSTSSASASAGCLWLLMLPSAFQGRMHLMVLFRCIRCITCRQATRNRPIPACIACWRRFIRCIVNGWTDRPDASGAAPGDLMERSGKRLASAARQRSTRSEHCLHAHQKSKIPAQPVPIFKSWTLPGCAACSKTAWILKFECGAV
jgi:hypothetical protein